MSSRREELSSRSFRSFVTTQFLGAFNDNAFKQLVVLVAVDLKLGGHGDYVFVAQGLFALPFVLFSGFAGNLADRLSKTRIILWAKVAEIAVMALGTVAFFLGDISLLLFTLFLMGTQSAFFGPAKYGILPQMLRRHVLSRANGIVLTTTFLAVILGMAVAGDLKERFPESLHAPGVVYVLLALLGTATALGIRRLPPVERGLSLRRPFGDLWPTFRRIAQDRSFILVIFAHSTFWFLGAVMQITVVEYGKGFLELGDRGTSFLLVSLSLGLAAGGILGGRLSRDSIRFALTRWGMLATMLSLTALSLVPRGEEVLAHVVLFALGVSGSVFALPLQTYIQQRPPEGEKGRVVAAANFSNWVFISLSAAYIKGADLVLPGVRWVPVTLAVITLLLALVVWPRLGKLQAEVS